jgi:4-amino-4-deoxy-L-arabinose transferase-like glycosyltransferase
MNGTVPTGRDRLIWIAWLVIVAAYAHNTVPYLTMMPRVNVDEPWLMERAFQVWRTGIPSQPMMGLHHAYLLQVGYGYLLAPWFGLLGFGILQARAFGVLLGLGILIMVALIGRRAIGAWTGVGAALFLALDSNFLGGVRNARTDIPAVFFIAAAFAAYSVARHRSRPVWFAVSGACVGLAMLCHGNAFWAAAILLAWYLIDYQRSALTVSFGYALIAGVLLTFGPYLFVVMTRWADVQAQIETFASPRIPGWRPAFILGEMIREIDRYRNWYFGLVTNGVPNPLLWLFQVATIVGIVGLAVQAWGGRALDTSDRRGALRLLVLAIGAACIFAGWINNKVPVYFPHLLIGFSLAAGFAVNEAARIVERWCAPRVAVCAFVIAYGAAGVLYYEKWYNAARKSELVPYESTEATLRALVPAGPKMLIGSPHFWPPFHAEPGVDYRSYSAGLPSSSEPRTSELAGGRPMYLLVDELQWKGDVEGWVDFITRHCRLDGTAFGSAFGTLAMYQCEIGGIPPARAVRIIGGSNEYSIGEPVLMQAAADLFAWMRYEDPRRTSVARPEVRQGSDGLEISGTGWPGIVKTFSATPGQRYLVRTATARARDGDLLYLGTWQRPEVLSLSGASSAGIPAQLVRESWFPHDRAFVATSPTVRVAVYSEAPETDFVISSLDIYRLEPQRTASAH